MKTDPSLLYTTSIIINLNNRYNVYEMRCITLLTPMH